MVNLLLLVIMPRALFGVFLDKFELAMVELFLWEIGGGLLIFLVFIIVGRILFSKHWNKKLTNVYGFAFVFNDAIFLEA